MSHVRAGGNAYLNGARPHAGESNALDLPRIGPDVNLVVEGDDVFLQMRWDDPIEKTRTRLVTTEALGEAKVPGLPYEAADGSPLNIGVDFFGAKRDATNPTPGSFERPGRGELRLKVRRFFVGHGAGIAM